jgi:hypothetical protein
VGKTAVRRRHPDPVYTDDTVPAYDHRFGGIYRTVAGAKGFRNTVQKGELNFFDFAMDGGIRWF